MKHFKIYRNHLGRREAVKQGWSWPAFCFGPLWALWSDMWALGLGGIFGLPAVFSIVSVTSNSAIGVLILDALVRIGFGAYGNQLRQGNLTARGYEEVTTVEALTPEGAIAAYVKQTKAS